jgi:hypothetical protein
MMPADESDAREALYLDLKYVLNDPEMAHPRKVRIVFDTLNELSLLTGDSIAHRLIEELSVRQLPIPMLPEEKKACPKGLSAQKTIDSQGLYAGIPILLTYGGLIKPQLQRAIIPTGDTHGWDALTIAGAVQSIPLTADSPGLVWGIIVMRHDHIRLVNQERMRCQQGVITQIPVLCQTMGDPKYLSQFLHLQSCDFRAYFSTAGDVLDMYSSIPFPGNATEAVDPGAPVVGRVFYADDGIEVHITNDGYERAQVRRFWHDVDRAGYVIYHVQFVAPVYCGGVKLESVTKAYDPYLPEAYSGGDSIFVTLDAYGKAIIHPRATVAPAAVETCPSCHKTLVWESNRQRCPEPNSCLGVRSSKNKAALRSLKHHVALDDKCDYASITEALHDRVKNSAPLRRALTETAGLLDRKHPSAISWFISLFDKGIMSDSQRVGLVNAVHGNFPDSLSSPGIFLGVVISDKKANELKEIFASDWSEMMDLLRYLDTEFNDRII